MTAVRAVLLDLDGTLVDSAPDLQASLNVTLREEGLREVSLVEVTSMVGDGAAKLVERAWAATGGDERRLRAGLDRFLAHYGANATHATRAYPGVGETLAGLHGAGMRLACITNKPEAPARQILETLGLDSFFDMVVGGDTLPQRKPDPAPLAHALSELGIPPDLAVMVGDNYHDVVAARAAGVRSVVVTYGYSHKPPAELGADALIDAFEELPQALNRIAG